MNLTADERERLVLDATAVALGACPVVAGILELPTKAAIQAAMRAEAAGPGAPASTWITGPSPSWPPSPAWSG